VSRVLIVDDEAGIRSYLRGVLERQGYEVQEAKDGHEALLLFAEFPADVVVLDIFMPRKEGLETIRELRKVAPRVKIIVITGGWSEVDVDLLDVARKLGAHDALQKPFSSDTLLAAMTRLSG